MNTKTKRPRIMSVNPNNVDYRINQIKKEIGKGLTKFELKWLLIQNDLKSLNKTTNTI
jgi:hypothetical protein